MICDIRVLDEKVRLLWLFHCTPMLPWAHILKSLSPMKAGTGRSGMGLSVSCGPAVTKSLVPSAGVYFNELRY